jgi:heme exporter protein C
VVFVASVAYLITKKIRWDRLAVASAEVGVVFHRVDPRPGFDLGQAHWGTWWTWDPRLTTTAVLLLVYVGYLAIRRLPDSPATRARWAAVVGIVAFVDVPIVHLSVVWWRSQHQAPALLHVAPRMAGSWCRPDDLARGPSPCCTCTWSRCGCGSVDSRSG